MKTPYETLGVQPDATLDEIKAAYRKAALKFHPDREGGDKAAFQEAQGAYATLSDPKKRQRYDETGEASDEPTLRQKAEILIPDIVEALLNSPLIDPDWQDLKSAVVKEVEQALKQDRNGWADMERRRSKLQRALKRFKRIGGENMVAARLQYRIDEIGKHLEGNTLHQQLLAEVLDVLSDYSYNLGDEPETEVQLLGNSNELVQPV